MVIPRRQNQLVRLDVIRNLRVSPVQRRKVRSGPQAALAYTLSRRYTHCCEHPSRQEHRIGRGDDSRERTPRQASLGAVPPLGRTK